MAEIKSSITINRPIEEVFAYTLDPENTPKWVEAMLSEKRNETPTKLGTVYSSTWQDGAETDLIITDFEDNKTFTMSTEDRSFQVQYTFAPLSNGSCQLDYFTWGQLGNETEAVIQGLLQKLKELIENDE